MNLVFDLDGTLVDSAPDLLTAVNVVLVAEDRRPLTLDELRRFVGRGSKVLLERAFAATGGPASDLSAAYDHYFDAYRAVVADQTQLFDGASAVLQAAQAEGIGLALCTNKPEAPTRDLLEALDLTETFGAAVVGGDTLPVRKPDPAAVHEAIARLGGAPRPSVFVGDSETDVAAARAARLPVIAVPWGYRQGTVDELGADAVIGDFADLLASARALVG